MALSDVLAQQISRITIETAFLPSVSIDNPFQPGPPNPYLQQLRPKVTLELAGGALPPVVIAPYGDPGAAPAGSSSKIVAAAGLGLFLLALRVHRRMRGR